MSPDTGIAAPPPRYSTLGAWLIFAVMVGVIVHPVIGPWQSFRAP